MREWIFPIEIISLRPCKSSWVIQLCVLLVGIVSVRDARCSEPSGPESTATPKAAVVRPQSGHADGAFQETKPHICSELLLTRKDIPVSLPSELKVMVEKTFSENPQERAQAATRIGKMHAAAVPAIPFLIRLLPDGKIVGADSLPLDDGCDYVGTRTVSDAAAHALCNIGESAVLPCLDSLEHNLDNTCRRDLMFILSELKDPRAIKPLIALLNHRNGDIRITALIAVWDDPRFAPQKLHLLKDDNVAVRRTATSVLNRHQDARFVVPLIEALADKDVEVQSAAADSLGFQRDRRAIPFLLRAVRDESGDLTIRQCSAKSLGKIADLPTLNTLVAMVKDQSLVGFTRDYAAMALGTSRDPRFLETLAPLAKDRREKKLFRKGLIDDIATLGGQKAIPELTQIATCADEDIDLRCRAAVRIVTLTDGAIDDMRILDGLQGNFIPRNFLERNTYANNGCVKHRAYSAVAKNGKTDEIRRMARERRGSKP